MGSEGVIGVVREGETSDVETLCSAAETAGVIILVSVFASVFLVSDLVRKTGIIRISIKPSQYDVLVKTS